MFYCQSFPQNRSIAEHKEWWDMLSLEFLVALKPLSFGIIQTWDSLVHFVVAKRASVCVGTGP